jgi:transcriptional regulator with GAF, ATPase, and Fis domain
MTQDPLTTTAPPATSRCSRLAETFVVLADTLVDDYDVIDLLDTLAAACVSVLGVTAAGLLLDDQRGGLGVAATSSEDSRLLELFQLQSNQGPCLECVRSGAAVVSADLAADSERWPMFVPVALGAGVRSMVAVPLRLRLQTIGGLNLFSSEPAAVSPAEQRLAQALADVATIGILQHRSAHRNTMLAEQLQHALNSRVAIEQAKGVLAERFDTGMEAAYWALRRIARDGNMKIAVAALSVLEADEGGGGPRTP